jgi:hypothetical protein
LFFPMYLICIIITIFIFYQFRNIFTFICQSKELKEQFFNSLHGNITESDFDPEEEYPSSYINELINLCKGSSISYSKLSDYLSISFPYYFYQYLAISIEMFIITVILIRDTKVKDGDILTDNGYNICYLVFQIGMFSSMLMSKCLVIRFLALFPCLQFLFLLTLIYFDIQGECSLSKV